MLDIDGNDFNGSGENVKQRAILDDHSLFFVLEDGNVNGHDVMLPVHVHGVFDIDLHTVLSNTIFRCDGRASDI